MRRVMIIGSLLPQFTQETQTRLFTNPLISVYNPGVMIGGLSPLYAHSICKKNIDTDKYSANYCCWPSSNVGCPRLTRTLSPKTLRYPCENKKNLSFVKDSPLHGAFSGCIVRMPDAHPVQ